MIRLHVTRTGRRALAVSLVLAGTTLLSPAPPVLGAGTACSVSDLTHPKSHASLQAAVNAATKGDTLQVRGLCIGSTVVHRNLTIVGKRTPTSGKPTLDGDHAGQVLRIGFGTKVSITGLTIRNGLASGTYPDDSGGGIGNEGTLTLTDVIVRANSAVNGGGISDRFKLTIRGRTSIDHNHADSQNGGGIDVDGTDRTVSLVMEDRSRVHDNSARQGGGINVFAASVTLADHVAIDHNAAGYGGGIAGENSDSVVARIHLTGSSAVHHNGATAFGGAINTEGKLTLSDASSVHDNDSSAAAGSATIEVYSYTKPMTFTMQGSSSVRDNTAGVGGAGVVSWQDCGVTPVLVGVKSRTESNTPRNIYLRPGTTDC